MTSDEQQMLKVGAEALLKPVSNLIERIFGVAADEIGLILGNELRARRMQRQATLFKKVQEAVNDAGFEPQQVSDKIWMPILQSASLEDDEFLQEQWAALLANAADPRSDNQDLASFARILEQLTSRDAKFLKALYTDPAAQRSEYMNEPTIYQYYVGAGVTRMKDVRSPSMRTFAGQPKELDDDHREFLITVDRLLYLRLLAGEDVTVRVDDEIRPPVSHEEMVYKFTALGQALVRACMRPTL
jgi:hypothetical protein